MRRTQPAVIPIATAQTFEIPAANYVHYTFQLPATVCTVTGRVEGISGGRAASPSGWVAFQEAPRWVSNPDRIRNPLPHGPDQVAGVK
jgi:hypothetical protein